MASRMPAVRDLPSLLRPGDVMVVNDTRVIPARLHAHRGAARIEVMLNRSEGAGIWHALVRNARRLRAGDVITIDGAADCTARVIDAPQDGAVMLDFGPDQGRSRPPWTAPAKCPCRPTSPAGRPAREDSADYQTIFAQRPGAVAAPTASLHFTPVLLDALEARGVRAPPSRCMSGGAPSCPCVPRIRARTACTPNGARSRTTRLPPSTRHVPPAAGLLPSAPPRCACWNPRWTSRPHQSLRGLTDIYLLPGHRFRSADC